MLSRHVVFQGVVSVLLSPPGYTPFSHQCRDTNTITRSLWRQSSSEGKTFWWKICCRL